MNVNLSDRQRREREYYSVYSRRYAAAPVDFEPVDPGAAPRPWNPYWYCHRRLLDFHRDGARRLLDFGCGWGDVSIRAARAGYEVHGFDITPENIKVAKARAARENLADRTHFTVGTAERLHYAPASFDVVIGIDILHHVDVASAAAACREVLRPDGHILFKEPVRAVLFDSLRNTRLARRLFPVNSSYDHHITEDERKLDSADLLAIEKVFPSVDLKPFRLFARAERILPLGITLEKLDLLLLRHVTFLRPFAGSVVIEARLA